MPATVRQVSWTVTLAGTVLDDVISARGQVVADSGWPTCSVFVRTYPQDGGGDPIDEENDITVEAGAGNNDTRFTGRLRRFRTSAFPRGLELVCVGTLAYADEWAPDEDIVFEDEFPNGATDQEIVQWALDHVPGVTYSSGDIDGTGITLGLFSGPQGEGGGAPEAFDWAKGVSAWQYIQEIDRATLYRTYQTRDGTIRRVQMIGHPHDDPVDFTLAAEDILDGASGTRDTERTRNAVVVIGHDYGDGQLTMGVAYGSNAFQGDGSDPATRHAETYSSGLIEDGSSEDGDPWNDNGIDAQDIADAILPDVNKEFVEADIPSWRDDSHGPGLTCLLDMLDRLHIGESMWVQSYAWEVGDNGWQSRYGLTGGGLTQSYTPPDN